MEITKNFSGGNINVLAIDGDNIFIEREVREGTGYFYWAFCVTGAAGRTLRFRFPGHTRVGRFGAAVSHDLKSWQWGGNKEIIDGGDSFTYTFSSDESCVFFAHDMVYSEAMLRDFADKNGIVIESFTKSNKDRSVPCFSIGDGERLVIVTSRHHACESTGTYVLEGFATECLKKHPHRIKFLFIPFVDYDGVTEGHHGKGRAPYDHNRDYGDAPIYRETARIRELVDGGNVLINFDFHSPHHDSGINDYPYLMKFSPDENEIYSTISGTLRELTLNDEASMTYTGLQDLPYGDQWNSPSTPNVKNYVLKRSLLNASITMETPYFGLDDNMFTQEKAINMGRHLYNAFYKIIKEL